MPNRNLYDPFRQELQPGRQHQEGGDYGWTTPSERRSFGEERTGYGERSRDDDEPAYGGQGAYGQRPGPGAYGYGLQSGGNREDYAYGGQGGYGPAGGGYGAQDRNRIRQGNSTYNDRDYTGAARRSVSREDNHDHDPHYQRWHDEQMRAHDRDYARWRDERAEQYHREYHDWRNQRREAFARDFDDWRNRQGQSSVQDVTDGGDGSHHDKDENR